MREHRHTPILLYVDIHFRSTLLVLIYISYIQYHSQKHPSGQPKGDETSLIPHPQRHTRLVHSSELDRLVLMEDGGAGWPADLSAAKQHHAGELGHLHLPGLGLALLQGETPTGGGAYCRDSGEESIDHILYEISIVNSNDYKWINTSVAKYRMNSSAAN